VTQSKSNETTRRNEVLTRTFEEWRAEFRVILEDHRREIQDRLEKIEREIENKSDKENVDVVVRGIHDELRRHASEIACLHNRVSTKMESETMWKIIGLALTLGGGIGGLIGFLIHLLLRLNP
jgi:predicted phage gp36 major capsid-like protein